MKDQVIIQGHRGCRGLMPENTIPGFLHALELGLNTLELDVVVSADNHLILSHEPYLNADICTFPDGGRLSPEEGELINIYRMTSANAAKFDCGSLGSPDFPAQKKISAHKPLLKELCDALRQFCKSYNYAFPFLNIELKSRPQWYDCYQPEPARYIEIVKDELEAAGLKEGFSLQSFDFAVLREIHTALPDTLIICLNETPAKSMENCFAELGFIPWGYSQFFEQADASLVKRCRESNVLLSVWTVNSAQDASRLLDAGVRNIITDYPDRMLTLLEEKGFELFRY